MIMTRIEKLMSRRDAQEKISFCWSPFPEERLDGNDVINEVTRRYRADASYNGEIAFANIY